jgi:hypothetical protein
MKYSLDVQIIHSTASKVQDILDAFPASSDSKVDSDLYEMGAVGDEYNEETGESTGNYQGNAMIRYNNSTDRTATLDIINAIQDILDNCEVGSWIRELKCYHDEDPPSPCEVETLWEVTV